MPGISLSLAQKVAVISGGSRGIGAATVRMFAAAGAKVAFNYLRARNEAAKVVESCGGEANCIAVQADFADSRSPGRLTDAAIERFGRLDALVANHGIWPANDVPIDGMPDEQWRRTMTVNLDSVFGLVKHAVAEMKKQGSGGHIVLVAQPRDSAARPFTAITPPPKARSLAW